MPLSAYLRDAVLNKVLRGQDFVVEDVYISLHTAYPGLTGLNEVSGGEYVRSAATFTRPVDGRSKMDTGIRYTQMPNAVLTHIGIWTAQRGGMFLWGDALTNPVDVRAGNTFAMAALSVTVVLE